MTPKFVDTSAFFYHSIFENLNVGLLALDKDRNVLVWNKFLEVHTGLKENEVIGKNLFDLFPYLPQKWLNRKLKNVFLLKSFSYTSWKERPHLFEFKHNRPITASVENMYQDITFMPIKNNEGEVVAVTIAISDMTDVGIFQGKLKEANDMIVSLEEKSQVDGLTKVFNRMTLDFAMETEFERAKLLGKDLCFMLLDLDHFKNVNDTHGHQAGDEVLRVTAAIAKATLRDNDIIGRYGGEEFGLILPGTDIGAAAKIAERLRESIAEKPVAYEDITISVTISIGLSINHGGINGIAQLIKEADVALYESKANGRNRVTTCRGSI